jgi:hypothetical protein
MSAGGRFRWAPEPSLSWAAAVVTTAPIVHTLTAAIPTVLIHVFIFIRAASADVIGAVSVAVPKASMTKVTVDVATGLAALPYLAALSARERAELSRTWPSAR